MKKTDQNIKKLNEQDVMLIKTKDVVGFTADYLMHNLYELNFEEQRQVLYSLCGNLYLAESNLKLLLNENSSSSQALTYQAESFKRIQYLTLNIQTIVSEFLTKQRNNSEFMHYRNILASLSV